MISVHTTPEEFQNVTMSSHFGFMLEQNSCSVSRDYRHFNVFEKKKTLRFQNVPVHTKTKSRVFNLIFRFEERFRKAPFP